MKRSQRPRAFTVRVVPNKSSATAIGDSLAHVHVTAAPATKQKNYFPPHLHEGAPAEQLLAGRCEIRASSSEAIRGRGRSSACKMPLSPEPEGSWWPVVLLQRPTDGDYEEIADVVATGTILIICWYQVLEAGFWVWVMTIEEVDT